MPPVTILIVFSLCCPPKGQDLVDHTCLEKTYHFTKDKNYNGQVFCPIAYKAMVAVPPSWLFGTKRLSE